MSDAKGESGDEKRAMAFAGDRADELERWLAEVQAPPHARVVLEAEILRLRAAAAVQAARAELVQSCAPKPVS